MVLRGFCFSLIVTTALAAPALASEVQTHAPAAPPAPERPDMHYVPAIAHPVIDPATSDARLDQFKPTTDPIRHRIDYETWDFALKHIVMTMGPSERKGTPRPDPLMGTRIKQGVQSRYRLEGSMVIYRFFDQKVVDSFTAYRKDLESVTETLDIASLPRNEQLAFWLNLHNVALLEQIARAWPLREPEELKLDGVQLDEARFITVKGVPVSLRDIRENIVFRHWKDPKVIYGFWRGAIGGPELQRDAFTGGNVGSLLDIAAADYVNSLRGTQQRGETLEVSSLYAEVAPFYFPDFDRDLRAHLARYAEEPVGAVLEKTSATRATIRQTEIADLHGGARPPNYVFGLTIAGAEEGGTGMIGWAEKMGVAALDLIADRDAKLMRMQRRGQPIGRVFFSNIDLPGDPPNKNAVE